MLLRCVLTLFCFVSIALKGVSSLKDVQLIVDPPIVIRGGTATLACARDMQGTPLYSVKWYRGNHEFYRYTPNEIPNTRVFGILGIFVDMNQSNGSQVLLRRLDLNVAGNFSCEVTAEAPPFSTLIATKHIDIVAPPPKGPVLHANKDRYQPGETLQVNCSSSPSRPASNLTIYVNDEPHRSLETSLHASDNGLLWTNVNIELEVTADMFIGGRLRVTCLSTIYNVYRSSSSLDFFDSDPRPERITFSRTARSVPNLILLLFVLMFPLIIMGQDLAEDSSFLEDYFQYYEDGSDKNTILSLMGG